MPVTPVIVPSPGVGTHGTIASSDGAQFGSISGESQFLYNSGGPPLLGGAPSQFTFERVRSWMGKGQQNGAITATAIGDMSLVFTAAPKTLMRGQIIYLGGGTTEYVLVADSFVPSDTATTIPLSSPVVNAGHTSAQWDVFSIFGPGLNAMTLTGVGINGVALQSQTVSSTAGLAVNAAADATDVTNVLEIVPGLYTGQGQAERQRGPNVFKPFNAQAAAGGEIKSPPLGNGVISALANNKLWIDATSATTLTGFVWGTDES
jgi:hypothetical protein